VSEADIVICSDRATFIDNHVLYGAIVHSAIALAKRVPCNHIVRMALMGEHEIIDAKRALEIGLVTEIVPHERLIPRATEIAGTIMRNSPTAVQASVESLSLGLRDAMQVDSYMQRYYNYHPDLAEAARALIERRRPAWRGSSWYESGYHKGER
jgi:enoyl-CoA hydratase/carnithine racemase